MDNLSHRLNFNPGNTNEILYHRSREHLKLSEIAKLVAKCSKRGRKYGLAKFANFICECITHGKPAIFAPILGVKRC